MKLLPLLFLVMLQNSSFAQGNKAWQFAVSNSHSSYPFGSFSKLFYKEFNPGFSVGKQMDLFKKHKWVSAVRLNYLFHQQVQHTASVTVEAGYRIRLTKGFYFTPNLGAGIMQAFSTGKTFKLNDQGEYEIKKNFGRTQGLLLLSERLDKQILKNGTSLFIAYQQTIQAPFIKKYVPMLPYNSILIGVSIPHKK